MEDNVRVNNNDNNLENRINSEDENKRSDLNTSNNGNKPIKGKNKIELDNSLDEGGSGFERIARRYGENFFEGLTEYIKDTDVTDINCNGRDVWINHIHKGRYKADINYTEEDICKLAYKISNTENVQFNVNYPILEADLFDLRFHFTHKSFSVSGTTCSIRKTPTIARIKEETIDQGDRIKYLHTVANNLLKLCVKCRLNFVICGLTGSGKTELVKYLMKFTKDYERIITIEDTSELHLREIYPDKDVVELKVNDFVDYDGAIKSCMRMLPVWINLSEARGKEVKELIKCISTGAKIITTIHCDNAKQIPSRLLNMFEDNELSNEKVKTMIYDYINIGIHIKAEFEGTTIRYVDQIVYFENDEDGNNKSYEIYKVTKDLNNIYHYSFKPFPDSLLDKLGISREDSEKFWKEA